MATTTFHRTSIRTTFPKLKAVVLAPTIVFAFAGCAARGPAAVTPSPINLGCDQPVTLPVSETPARQTHGDISMLMAIEVPPCDDLVVEVSWEERSRGMFGWLTAWGPRKNAYRRTERQLLRLTSGMTASLTITNQSERVFRGEDAVWSATLDGAIIPSEAEGVVNAMIPPGRNQEIRVTGIQTDESGTYTLSLFDVPIQQNAAGETIEVANFEWIYTLEHNRVPVQATATTCNFNLTLEEVGDLTQAGMARDDLTLAEMSGLTMAQLQARAQTQAGRTFGGPRVMTLQDLDLDPWRCQ